MSGFGSCFTTSKILSNKKQLASVSPQPPNLLSGPRPDTSSSLPRFTVWCCQAISKPSTSSSQLRMLYSSFRVALGRTLVWADLALHHPGNPRPCAPSGQLQTMLELHHSAPAQLILYRGRRLVVCDQSHSLQLTGLGKSLPLTCQQQLSLNNKRRIYSAHMKGEP